MNNFLSYPLFWMSVYLIGYTIVIIALSLKKTLIIVENKIPKPLLRVYIFSITAVRKKSLPWYLTG